ncbi:tRNA (adenosine(37)-N6)-dimethylallyltransferase MiaA [Prochlorococcus sp. MIT 1307]|uniref:tRNA (adenosine(37)-N6)-dimethylallyltransferase MiaA n=1 Tax=Prochlorococcus sp. MIT 1307 TaxID=3096219 RepID=UPI002A75090F|nr:tRNA (adenosine(37)-N6)-dimethylallyltransferase MiaA [Prochlorococcus sp. MIT 1307]
MQATKPLIIVLLGPTASGKTEISIDLAAKLKLGIHNIDSRQLYAGMDIGTAKPSKEQMNRVRHYLIDIRKPDEPITLKEFQETAQASLKNSLKNNPMAFLVGGSGLYLKALTSGLRPSAVPPIQDLRKQLSEIGQQECYQILKSSDPNASKRIAPADAVRTQRALEVLFATGKSITQQESAEPPPWKILELGLNPKNLRERIAKRTTQLYKNGLIEETEQLIHQYNQDLSLLQTIGYGEALKVIQGKLTRTKAIEITNLRTNQFAKRQRTWFRRQHNPIWLNDEEPLREALSLIKTGLDSVKQT